MTYYSIKQLVISQIDKMKTLSLVLFTDILRFMLATVMFDTHIWDV